MKDVIFGRRGRVGSYSEDELIKKVLKACKKTLKRAPAQRWPIRSHSITPYFYKDFQNEIIQDYLEIRNNEFPLENVALAFHNSKRIWRILHHIIFSMLFSGTPTKLQKEIIIFLMTILGFMKKDPFNSDGNNLWYRSSRINEIVSKINYGVNTDNAVGIHKLAGLLWSYFEALFFVFHGAGFEIHGIYHNRSISPNSLLIRTYFDISPDLWPELSRAPYKDIEIGTIYTPNLKVRFSELGTIVQQHGNFVECLEGFYVTRNGKPLTANLTPLIEHFSKRLSKIGIILQNWSLEDLVKRYIDIFWYQLKPMKDILHRNWRPTKNVYDNVMPFLHKIDYQKRINPRQLNLLDQLSDDGL